MLAKTKLEQLKHINRQKQLDKMILEAIKLDLIDKKEIKEEEVPKELVVISESYLKKVSKHEHEHQVTYYVTEERYDQQLSKTVRTFTLISIVEDFEEYYQDILNITKEEEKESNTTYLFLMTIAWTIMIIGVAGGLVLMSQVVEIGFGAMLSTSAFSAILFGIAKIIKLIK